MVAAAQAVLAARRLLKEADAEVAASAKEQGISKEEAWAGVQAEVQRQTGETIERVFDPMGWGAARRAFDQAERDNAS